MVVTTRTRALLPLVLLVLVALGASPASAITPVDSTPVVTLHQMAESPVLFETGDFALDRSFHTATETFPFALPAGTSSGRSGESWFLLDLSYTIVFGDDSASGFAWVSADTNSLTAAQAEYVLTRSPTGLEIRESTVTLQDGQEERDLDGFSASVDYVNYARDEGITSGRNSFTVRVEHTDGVVIERVEFHGNSGVSLTTVSPDPFQLSATVEADEIRVGDEFDVSVRAVNASNLDVDDALIEAAPSDGFARLLDPALLELGQLEGATDHTYRFIALRAGPGQVAILGSSSRNEPHAILDLTVLPASSSSAATLAIIALAGAAPVILIGGLLVVRARRRA